MTRSRSAQLMTARLDAGGRSMRPDELAVEEPMEIRLDGATITTTMRTPGNDYELAVGFCHSEGLLAGVPVRTVRYCATGGAAATHYNVVTVETGRPATEAPGRRLTTTTSSCGICGTISIDALTERLEPLTGPPLAVDPGVLSAVSDRTREQQALFSATGSIHAAASFDPRSGEVDLVREDIGRHNAVDKLVGRLVLDGRTPATPSGLFVSGRVSFEIVQKAWAAGFGMIAAVSGPTTLAVQTARRANITLAGFVRDGAANVYAPLPLA